MITMALLGTVFEPRRSSVGLILLYAGFVGLVLYLILAMSDPFRGGLAVDPRQLENLLEVWSSP